MIRIFLGVTHKPWFQFLAARSPDEVNFWQPSGTNEFRALRPGDLFLFKLKGADNAIAGGGWFEHASIAPISIVWDEFREGNGVSSIEEMRTTVGRLRHTKSPVPFRDDPAVGCRILSSPFFWPPEMWIPTPQTFARNTVVGKLYSNEQADGAALWRAVEERLTARPIIGLSEVPARYGPATAVRRRLGQGAFRLAVTDGYARRCAVSGEKTLPILDAAHIRSYAAGGHHEVSNGILLRTDIHKLFDLGYVTVTNQRRFAVSERLKADFDNGVHYYAMQGREVSSPRRGFDAPSDEVLRWHRENRYLG